MPWSNQGGAARGAPGPKGPWGGGPQSSGPTPPDLEDMLRRSQDKLRSVMPAAILAARDLRSSCWVRVLLWGFSGFFRVEPDELGVVLRFGKYIREVTPGLNYHIALSDRERCCAEGAARQPHRYRHATGRRCRAAAPPRATCRRKA